MKHKKSILEGNIIYTLFAILMGFLTGAIILAIAGMNPGVIYAKLISGIFSVLDLTVMQPSMVVLIQVLLL